jgi:hypothetical protein
MLTQSTPFGASAGRVASFRVVSRNQIQCFRRPRCLEQVPVLLLADDVHDLGAVIRTTLGVVTAEVLADVFLCQLALTA